MRTFRQNKEMEARTEFAMVFAFRQNIAKYFASSKNFKVMLKCLGESQFQGYFSAKGLRKLWIYTECNEESHHVEGSEIHTCLLGSLFFFPCAVN